MGKEIERKFLVNGTEYRINSQRSYFKQGYIPTDKGTTVRVRIADGTGFITIKNKISATTRNEYEYEIPVNDAEEMISNICKGIIIEKYRYFYNYQGFVWEIDEFLGDNEGLVVAEIELPNEETEFEKPDFVDIEVTEDYRYTNSQLSVIPYKSWK